jgi:hypothetical protein
MDRLFQTKEARDQAYRDLLAQGIAKRDITRTSHRNQLLHPMYVEDYTGLEKHDTGFGNTVYKTHFAVLYVLRVWR